MTVVDLEAVRLARANLAQLAREYPQRVSGGATVDEWEAVLGDIIEGGEMTIYSATVDGEAVKAGPQGLIGKIPAVFADVIGRAVHYRSLRKGLSYWGFDPRDPIQVADAVDHLKSEGYDVVIHADPFAAVARHAPDLRIAEVAFQEGRKAYDGPHDQ